MDDTTKPSQELIELPQEGSSQDSTPFGSPRDSQGRVQLPTTLPPNLNNIETRRAVILLIASGSTIRRVITELAVRTGKEFDENKIFELFRLYSDDVDKAREERAELIMSTGLVRKETRLSKLSELAEDWEAKAKMDPKAAAVYLKALDQINKETESLNIPVRTPDDPWLCLLQDLQNFQVAPRLPAENTEDPIKDKSSSNSKDSESPPSVTNKVQ